jgi:hypothetical protein
MDVVSHFQPGGPVKGQAAQRHDFDGARYLLSSAQHKAAFVAGKRHRFSTARRMPADTEAAETVARAKQNWDQRQ